MSSLLILSTVLLLTSSPSIAQTAGNRRCYFPDGSFAPDYRPCNTTTTEDIHCCVTGETCISNGMCFGTNKGWPYRGGCTDQTWSSNRCPKWCREAVPTAWANLTPCHESNSNTFWCDNDIVEEYCRTNTFVWTTGTVMRSITAVTRTETSTSTTTTCEAGSPSTGNPTALASSTNTAVAAATTPSNPSIATGTSCPSVSKVQRDASLKTGLGTSIPLAAISAVLAALWLFERRKRVAGERTAGEQTPTEVSVGKMDDNGNWHDASASGKWYREMESSEPRELHGMELPAEVR